MIKAMINSDYLMNIHNALGTPNDPTQGDAYLSLQYPITLTVDDGYRIFIALDMWMKSKNATI